MFGGFNAAAALELFTKIGKYLASLGKATHWPKLIVCYNNCKLILKRKTKQKRRVYLRNDGAHDAIVILKQKILQTPVISHVVQVEGVAHHQSVLVIQGAPQFVA